MRRVASAMMLFTAIAVASSVDYGLPTTKPDATLQVPSGGAVRGINTSNQSVVDTEPSEAAGAFAAAGIQPAKRNATASRVQSASQRQNAAAQNTTNAAAQNTTKRKVAAAEHTADRDEAQRASVEASLQAARLRVQELERQLEASNIAAGNARCNPRDQHCKRRRAVPSSPLLRGLLTIDRAARRASIATAAASKGACQRAVTAARQGKAAALSAKHGARRVYATASGLVRESLALGRRKGRVAIARIASTWERGLARARLLATDPTLHLILERSRLHARLAGERCWMGARAAAAWVGTAARAAASVAHQIAAAASAAIDGGNSPRYAPSDGRSRAPKRESKRQTGDSSAGKRADGSNGGDVALDAQQRAEIGRILALPEDEHYLVLGVSETATAVAVKKAFRSLARLLHPDKCRARNAHSAFLRLQGAQEVLTDVEKRLVYDRQRALHGNKGFSSLHAKTAGSRSRAQAQWGQQSRGPVYRAGYRYS